jgi:hypothetical protein
MSRSIQFSEAAAAMEEQLSRFYGTMAAKTSNPERSWGPYLHC